MGEHLVVQGIWISSSWVYQSEGCQIARKLLHHPWSLYDKVIRQFIADRNCEERGIVPSVCVRQPYFTGNLIGHRNQPGIIDRKLVNVSGKVD